MICFLKLPEHSGCFLEQTSETSREHTTKPLCQAAKQHCMKKSRKICIGLAWAPRKASASFMHSLLTLPATTSFFSHASFCQKSECLSPTPSVVNRGVARSLPSSLSYLAAWLSIYLWNLHLSVQAPARAHAIHSSFLIKLGTKAVRCMAAAREGGKRPWLSLSKLTIVHKESRKRQNPTKYVIKMTD